MIVGHHGRTGPMLAVVEFGEGTLTGLKSLSVGERFFASEPEEVQGPPRVLTCSQTAEGERKTWAEPVFEPPS